VTIAPREFNFEAARRRLEGKAKSAGDKLTTLEEHWRACATAITSRSAAASTRARRSP